MKNNKVISICALLAFVFALAIITKPDKHKAVQYPAVSQERLLADSLISHSKLTEEKQELPPHPKFKKNYLVTPRVEYFSLGEGSATLTGKISPKKFKHLILEIGKMEWEDLSILLEQQYSLQLGTSYPISAFPEKNKDGSRDYYYEKFIFKEQNMVILYLSIPQYENKGI